MDTTNTYTGQGMGTTATPYNYSEYCPNRLPCGYCRLMCGMCPLQAHTTITWTSGYVASDINGMADSNVTKYNPDIPHTYTSSEVQT